MRKEPNDLQYRAAAVVLMIVAAVTATSLGMKWVGTWNEKTALPLVLAFIGSHVAYALYVGALRIQSVGAKLGIVAIVLNLVAMNFHHGVLVWSALTVLSINVALVGISRLLIEAAKRTSLG